MVDYNKYFNSVSITRNDAIRVIRPKFRKFDKEPLSMCFNVDQYGVQLCPEAELLLAQNFGYGEGLSIEVPKKRKSHGNKNKPNRMYVRISNNLYSRVLAVYNRMSFTTMQDLIESAINEFCANHEGGR